MSRFFMKLDNSPDTAIPERMHITGASTNMRRTITPWRRIETGATYTTNNKRGMGTGMGTPTRGEWVPQQEGNGYPNKRGMGTPKRALTIPTQELTAK
jgi:hypothetical protein